VQDGAELLKQLIDYRYDMQELINQMWNLETFSTWGQLYALFHEKLVKEKGYGKSVAKFMYTKARKIVETAKDSGAKDVPMLKKLVVEFDVRDARVDLERGEVRVIFKSKGRWFILRVKERAREIENRLSDKIYRLKNVQVSYENGKFYVNISFEVFGKISSKKDAS